MAESATRSNVDHVLQQIWVLSNSEIRVIAKELNVVDVYAHAQQQPKAVVREHRWVRKVPLALCVLHICLSLC